jgi:pimeloyl-ACP methyl ester carboxylesterase
MSPRPADFREPAHERDHLTGRARAWHAQAEPETHDGQTIDVHRRVGGAPLLLFLHGFPTSSFDWRFLLVQDREHAAVAFDYPGLGGSEKPADGDYSVTRVADLADRLVEEHGQGRRVLVVAHDLGVSVAAELIARDVEGKLGMELTGAVLLNGAVVPDDSATELGQKAMRALGARFGGERRFRSQLGHAFSPDHPLDDEEAADQWSLLTHNDGHEVGDRLLGYLETSPAAAERRQAALRDWPKPVRLVWGMCDPIAGTAGLEALRTLRPDAAVTELDDLGRFPQLEDPERVLTAVRESIKQ